MPERCSTNILNDQTSIMRLLLRPCHHLYGCNIKSKRAEKPVAVTETSSVGYGNKIVSPSTMRHKTCRGNQTNGKGIVDHGITSLHEALKFTGHIRSKPPGDKPDLKFFKL